MPRSGLADRFHRMVELTPGERNTLIQIEERTRTVSRGAVLLREHDRMDELFVVREGMMMAYVLLDDGSRQIVRFLFPGDIFALSALVYRGSPDTVVALSTAVLSVIDRSTFDAPARPRASSWPAGPKSARPGAPAWCPWRARLADWPAARSNE